MSIKEAYHYLFYKLYKLFQQDQFHWMREWRVYGIMTILGWSVFYILFMYYEMIFHRSINLGNHYKIFVYGTVGIIGIINFFIFHSYDQWKKIVKDFDAWPKKKNRIGTVIVYSVIALIIGNLIFALYLSSTIDWSLYR